MNRVDRGAGRLSWRIFIATWRLRSRSRARRTSPIAHGVGPLAADLVQETCEVRLGFDGELVAMGEVAESVGGHGDTLQPDAGDVEIAAWTVEPVLVRAPGGQVFVPDPQIPTTCARGVAAVG